MHKAKFKISQTNSFDQGYAIRGIAMIMIIFVHSINEYECYNSIISKHLLVPFFGVLGCCLFFFMSGYSTLCSLCKNRKMLTSFNFILKILKKILTPVAIVYIINSIILPHTLKYNDITINHLNLLTLSLPEGTDIWFIKIILFDYISTFLLFKITVNLKRLFIYIAITQMLLILILYICGIGSYCYVSNLCFVLGAFYLFFQLSKRKYFIISAFLFIVFYLCIINDIMAAPIQILGGLAFCILIISVISKKTRYPQWLIFIGKNSLLYYLLNIPIMWLIPSNNIHFIVYFIANIIFTTIFIFAYNEIGKLITRNITNK